MTVVARRFTASPARTSTETWDAITSLVEAHDSKAAKEFRGLRNLAASLINSEASAKEPIVISGAGPRVKIYCLFGDDAIDAEDSCEDALVQNPFSSSDWHVYLPCPDDEMKWMEPAVKNSSTRFTVYNAKDGYTGDVVVKAVVVEEIEVNLAGLRNL